MGFVPRSGEGLHVVEEQAFGGTLTRRALLGAGIAAGGMVLAGGWNGAAQARAAASRFSRSTWSRRRGQRFAMSVEGRTARVTLLSVADLTGASSGATGRFSLLFRTASLDVPGGLARFHRRGFPVTELFVTQVDRGVDARHYQAVINRI